jgi:hypothetical protein
MTAKHSRPARTDGAGITEKWFQALDHRRVGSGKRAWDVIVTGIHASGTDCWIQIASAADETRQLLLRVSSQTTIDDAIQVLAGESGGPMTPVLVA